MISTILDWILVLYIVLLLAYGLYKLPSFIADVLELLWDGVRILLMLAGSRWHRYKMYRYLKMVRKTHLRIVMMAAHAKMENERVRQILEGVKREIDTDPVR